MRRCGLLLAVVLVCLPSLEAQNEAPLRAAVQRYIQEHQQAILGELDQLLRIPDVAADRANIRRRAELLKQLLAGRGMQAELIETQGNPLVYGEQINPGANRTLLFYCHYDGQPVDRSKWRQEDPFIPVLRTGKLGEEGSTVINDYLEGKEFDPHWRLYARSASDDTAPIVALLTAMDALRSSQLAMTSNIRLILDGEEEAGSPSLLAAIQEHQEKFSADLMLILDGPSHPSGKPTLVYGARGIQTLQITVFGPRVPLHSGHYGNWAPNPAQRLASLLASMKDDQGRARVEGFYDGIHFSARDRRIMNSVPDDEEALKDLFGLASTDAVGKTLQEARNYPSLNVRGLLSAWVGDEARTIIPDRAVAEIDIRLVPETDKDVMAGKLIAHIRRQGYHVISEEPDDATRKAYDRIAMVRVGHGTNAFRTPLDYPAAQALVESLQRVWGAPPVQERTMGGTVPISPFINALGFPAVIVPIVNFDNNQHSPNENLRLGHLFDGILTFAAIIRQ